MREPSLLTMSGSSTPASCTFVAEKSAAAGAGTTPEGTPSPPEPAIAPACAFAYASNSPQEENGCGRPAFVSDREAPANAATPAASATSPATQPITLPNMCCSPQETPVRDRSLRAHALYGAEAVFITLRYP